MDDMFVRGWENFLARSSGPMNLRLILQPAMAVFLALRAGIKDAKAGRPVFLWTALTDASQRRELLHSGWKDFGKAFLISVTLDAVYQLVVHQFIYPLELVFTATLLVVVPYGILRGPVNRIARQFMKTGA